jgi:hypothetical protein
VSEEQILLRVLWRLERQQDELEKRDAKITALEKERDDLRTNLEGECDIAAAFMKERDELKVGINRLQLANLQDNLHKGLAFVLDGLDKLEKPRPRGREPGKYDIDDQSEQIRLLDELSGYLAKDKKMCRKAFVDDGTDLEGRMFALEALDSWHWKRYKEREDKEGRIKNIQRWCHCLCHKQYNGCCGESTCDGMTLVAKCCNCPELRTDNRLERVEGRANAEADDDKAEEAAYDKHLRNHERPRTL